MSWYRTGTIAVSGTTVTGTGTNWTDNKMGIGPGQALLIPGAGTVKMYEILRVDSATKLTLTSDAGAVGAGQAYAIMSFYSDSVPDFARRLSAQLSYYQSQMDGWQQIMTSTGTVTLQAPDGTQVTVSSFSKLTTDMNNKAAKGANSDITSLSGLTTALSITQGGTGANSAFGARTALSAVGVGDFGVGGNVTNYSSVAGCGFYSISTDTPVTGIGSGAVHMRSGSFGVDLTAPLAGTPRLFSRVLSNGSGSQWIEFYSTANTTKASDGTLKAASPVARIVKSDHETQRTDVCEVGFMWCGNGVSNNEAEGITISRLDVGVYVLTGSQGLASEGWQLLPPMDPGGMGELGVVEAEETESGGITIRLYKRKYAMSADGDIYKTKGELIDVPLNSWIDVRLDMPANSVWNQKQAAMVIPEVGERENLHNA